MLVKTRIGKCLGCGGKTKTMAEAKSGIHIKSQNKGKFTATKRKTGKSTSQLLHSPNKKTRARANFARMAKRHFKPLGDGGFMALLRDGGKVAADTTYRDAIRSNPRLAIMGVTRSNLQHSPKDWTAFLNMLFPGTARQQLGSWWKGVSDKLGIGQDATHIPMDATTKFARGGKAKIKAARKRPGGSNVDRNRKTSKAGQGPFVGPSGGAPAGSYPVTNRKQWAAAKSYARHAPNPAGIKAAADRVARKRGWLKGGGGGIGTASQRGAARSAVVDFMLRRSQAPLRQFGQPVTRRITNAQGQVANIGYSSTNSNVLDKVGYKPYIPKSRKSAGGIINPVVSSAIHDALVLYNK